jgi:hypothetical protein
MDGCPAAGDCHYFSTVAALQDKGLKNISKSATPSPLLRIIRVLRDILVSRWGR